MENMLDNYEEEKPLHSGEIYHLWSYLFDAKANVVTLQILINHSSDKDLKSFLEDLLENNFEEELQQIEGILKEIGVRLPPAPPDRPNVALQDIPAGARFNDSEIAHLIKKELICGRILCSYIIGCSLQKHLKSLFHEFHSQRTEYEQKLLNLSLQKGWIVFPPTHVK